MNRQFSFPSYLEIELKRIFALEGWTWSSRQLAQDILQLSDYYIQNPQASTPWDKAWAQRALLAYYWPLNTIRFQAVYQELRQVRFFTGLDHIVDFGAGPATASHVLRQDFSNLDLIENSKVPQRWFPQFTWKGQPQAQANSAALFCYSLTELHNLPDWAEKAEALVILEPATQQDGRQLLALRQDLLTRGFFAWAPCPHQMACPLLTRSKSDWCHDRVEVLAPTWFTEIEQHLPIKNRTITMSYLAMRRTPPPKADWARVTGDRLDEKGKSRQLVCRGPEREFMAWMHRKEQPPEIFRGERVQLHEFTHKSNELRMGRVSRVEST
ncbi:MAG: small ribosomal subunit Rsm22 family protein [Bdellovibrionales bacterium]